MKKILFALSVALALNAHAQLGLVKAAVGVSRETRANKKPLRNVDYTLDTIRHMDEVAPMQRYSQKDMASGTRDQPQLYELTKEINALQGNLDKMYQLLMAEKKIDIVSIAQQQLDEIEQQYPNFDRTLFEAEYQFYKRFQLVKTPETLEKEREQDELRKKENEKANEADLPDQAIITAEDPHVITDFDRKLDSSYENSHNAKISEARAHSKIMQIKEEQEQRRTDSLATVKKMEQQQKEAKVAAAEAASEAAQAKRHKAELAKKYGAKNAQLIIDGQVRIGMTKEMCRISWGDPADIHSTITGKSVHEQWVYSLTSYLYFDNGVLTVIQN